MKIPADHTHYGQATLRSVLSFLLITAGSLIYHAYGRQIDEKQAAVLAEKFIDSHSGSTQSMRRTAPRTETAISSENSGFYIFSTDESFVIVSGDDELKPIVGYSFSGTFDPENIPVQLTDFLNSYENGVNDFRAGRLAVGKSAGGSAVAPLLSTKWDQGEPYNNLCTPQYGSQNYYTGCVATAIAQVMKYHNYPPSGKGKTEERWTNPSVDLNESVYDWNNMLDEYRDNTWNETESAAVARLMRDVGAAVYMEYSTDASSAIWTYIAPALYRNFNYSPDIAMRSRESYDTDEWIAIIRENLLRGEPIIYGGSGNMGGHEFVVDGIDENDYVHINWGWSGSSDGYFDINALEPETLGAGAGNGKFFYSHTMVVNIRPGDPDADNSEIPVPFMAWDLRVETNLDAGGHLPTDRKSNAVVTFLMSNNTRKDVQGSSTLRIVTSLYDKDKKLINKNFTVPSGIRGYFSRDTYRKESINVDFSALEDGEYYLSLWYTHEYWSEQGLEKAEKEFDFASEPYIYFTVKDGEIYFPDQADSGTHLSIAGASQTDVIYQDASGELTIELDNNGKRPSEGDIYIYCLPEDVAPDNPEISALGDRIARAYFYAYGHSTNKVRATVNSNLPAGRYRLYFVFKNDLLSTADKYILEISPLPTDVPFVLTSPLTTEMETYENTNHEWMSITIRYIICDGWMDWTDSPMDFRFTAAHEDNPEDAFVLFEKKNEYFQRYDTKIKISEGPDVMWKKPGKYRFRMSYKKSTDSEWITPDDHNNTGTFILAEESPTGPVVDMAAPMVINGGHNVAPDSFFDVSLKIKTPTGISIMEEQSFVNVTDSPIKYNNYAFLRTMEFGKTELAAGEETDIKLSFYMPDTPELYNKRFLIVLNLYYEEYYAVIPRPGEYLESLYFTVDPTAGIGNVDCESFKCDIHNNEARIEGIEAGDEIRIVSVNGTVVRRLTATGNIETIPISDIQKGFYILTVNSPHKTYAPMKFKNFK